MSLDQKLIEFADSLVPSSEDITKGKSIFDRVVRALHKNKDFTIDRARILGSVGKATVINTHLDFDCVVYLNQEYGAPPPPEEIFKIWSDCLELAENLDVKIAESRSKRVLQATIEGFDFDIVPAINYSQDPEEQRRQAFEKIQNLPDPVKDGYKYSSSLSETQVDFITTQSSFAHQLIRLAKYWMYSLLIKDYISGKSSLIELIAIYASQLEESCVGQEQTPLVKSTSRSMTRAFKQFLTLMSNFHQLNIIFKTPYYQQNECQLNNGLCAQRPLVLDPSNPFNNFAFALSKKRKLMKKIEGMAAESLRRLERLERADLTEPNILETLFSPQPAVTPNGFMSNLPKNMVVTVEEGSRKLNKRVSKQTGSRIDPHGQMLLEHFTQDNINVQRLHTKPGSVKTSFQEILNRHLYKEEGKQWGGFGSHESCAMTMEIPCGTKTIKVSASW